MTNYRSQHAGFYAPLKSRYETMSDKDDDQAEPKAKHRVNGNALDGIIPVYSNTKGLAHRFSTSRKCIALYAMMRKAPEMTASPITSPQ